MKKQSKKENFYSVEITHNQKWLLIDGLSFFQLNLNKKLAGIKAAQTRMLNSINYLDWDTNGKYVAGSYTNSFSVSNVTHYLSIKHFKKKEDAEEYIINYFKPIIQEEEELIRKKKIEIENLIYYIADVKENEIVKTTGKDIHKLNVSNKVIL